MAYTKLCTVADIQAYFAGVTFSVDTKPTLVQVESWIDEATALIYSAVAEQYAIPITDAADLLVLRALCKEYVRDEVSFLLSKNRLTVSNNRALTPRRIDHKDFYKTLERIRNATFKLINTTASSEVNVYSYTAANDITAEATKETAQW